MSRQASILLPTSGTGSQGIISALAGVTASAVQTLGKNQMFVIVGVCNGTATTPGFHITFGNSTTSVAVPTATSYFIPFGQQTTFDLGPYQDSFQIFNAEATNTVTVNWMKLSVE